MDLDGRVTRLEYHLDRMMTMLDGRPGEDGLMEKFSKHSNAMQKRWELWDQREKDKMQFDERQEKNILASAKKQEKTLSSLKWGIGVFISLCMLIIALLAYEHETKQTLLEKSSNYYNAMQQKPSTNSTLDWRAE